MELVIGPTGQPLPGEVELEMVERKGLGHPDSICDALAEAFSQALCRCYLEHTGRVLHHNVDKVMLAAGSSEPAFGGGRIVAPMQAIFAGRAALEPGGVALAIAPMAEDVARRWLAANLHALDVDRHVAVACLVRPGSSELVDLFERSRPSGPRANDTSCGVGFAPLTELERMVLAIEAGLNSPETRASDPALGEDVKVMAFRRGDAVRVVVACAMIDGALDGLGAYRAARDRAGQIALEAARKTSALEVDVRVNVGDDIDAGQVYLTVTGTSAEAGDDGQTGRGNRVNGLITPYRPMTMESVAGKNPITHVGKLYNLAAGIIAQRVVDALPDLDGAECRLLSAIGCPIEEPQILEVRLFGPDAARCVEMREEVESVARRELRALPGYAERLICGELAIDRWPLEV